MLEFKGDWRYDSPGGVPSEVISSFRRYIEMICVQGQRKGILELFKRYFAVAAGVEYYQSSSESWASTDLDRFMSEAAVNAPLFIEAFYDTCEFLERSYPEITLPGVRRINEILSDTGSGYYIDPPRLVATNEITPEIVLEQPTPTTFLNTNAILEDKLQGSEKVLAERNVRRAVAILEDKLQCSEKALGEGNVRQAVSEALWALETISTVFRDEHILDGKVRGNYFNHIIRDLKQCESESSHLTRILDWMMNLYGYLSSPTGGGIRHGVDLKEGLELEIDEARLFCDLIRSYSTYLISKYKTYDKNLCASTTDESGV